ncbi:hypothetical protein CBR_g39739 [Chara braunii]|uniref:TFIID subunit TAF5 NTD2 domain-containing protein n=1 Tax=Chara braunii TaxID=69332 RepID=A0A388LS68_CHABU|nr:hypothetical protein CBR_g39739 [Chara braunii]|eukprot:GBG85174.1 hypothetical protein CBR_g39739 [Chara braunii]
MSTVVLEQPSAFAEEEEPITITGKPPDIMESLNQKEIQWGALEGSLEDKLEDKLASQNTSDKAETAEAGGANASKSQKKASVDSAKLPPNKKAKKDKASNVPGKAGKNEPSGSAVAVMRVKSTIPLPNLSEQAEKKALDELRKRVKLSPTALPNSCFYTFFNTYNSLNCVAFTDDGLVAGGFSDSSIKIWDMAKRSAVAGQSQEKATDVQILPSENGGGDANANDGQAGGKDSDAVVEAQRIAHGQKGRTYALLLGHTGPVYGLDFSPDSKYLLSSSADCTVRLWSVELNVNLVCYKGHNYPVWDVQYSPLGYYFASASHDRTARVWSMEKYYPLRIMAGHLSDVDCVRWHVNCNYIATGSSDKTVRLWDVQTGECMRIFTGHRGTVLSLAMSPSGRYVASGDENGTIIMWDIGSGRRLAPLLGHTDCVWTLAFSGDGSLLASGSADNTVRLWDATASTVKAGKLEDSRKSRLIKTLPTKSTPVYALRLDLAIG